MVNCEDNEGWLSNKRRRIRGGLVGGTCICNLKLARRLSMSGDDGAWLMGERRSIRGGLVGGRGKESEV